MDFISGSASQNFGLLQEFYQTTLKALEEAKNERLWFKTNLKLCKIWFDMGEYGRMNKELDKSCRKPDGSDDQKKAKMITLNRLESPEELHEMMSTLYRQQSQTLIHYEFFDMIPDAILAEILKRLPVKFLLRCRCVQKSWYHFIKTPMFINLHLNYHHHNTTLNNNPKYLLFRSVDLRKLFYIRSDDEQCQVVHNLQLAQLPDLPGWHATSSGLICSTFPTDKDGYFDGDIYLWNPLIQKCKILPSIPTTISFKVEHYTYKKSRHFARKPTISFKENSVIRRPHWVAVSFGYVSAINDYQVVKILNYSQNGIRSIIICVYSLNTDSWKTKTIQDDILFTYVNDFYYVSINGMSFWQGTRERRRTLLYFDSLNDIVGYISLPQEKSLDEFVSILQFGHYRIHQFGQSLALFVNEYDSDAITMWILKQDSRNNFSWEKKTTVPLKEHIYPEVLGLRNNGELILWKLREPALLSCDAENGKVNDFILVQQPASFTVHPFVDALVFLDSD
ncbi:hypothetical protein POM88_003744 [Heracleum sosnowskyi]|uniref:F-box domain-containing protein n=1 Tax=Heracleum sosnowskyi TaxID=360622 RepID=A0AAD8JH32_9APIA|nr:hypothetical protein POM88_003744 [Heracleum sosnowskyi]